MTDPADAARGVGDSGVNKSTRVNFGRRVPIRSGSRSPAREDELRKLSPAGPSLLPVSGSVG